MSPRPPQRPRGMALLPGLIAALGGVLLAESVAADAISEGDLAWARRAEGHQLGRPAPEPVLQAIRAYQRAVDSAPDELEPYWKLLRAHYFAGYFALTGEAAQRANYARAVEVSERGLEALARRLGSDPRSVELVDLGVRLDERGIARRDAARLHFWSAINWGAWGRLAGWLGAVRKGVAKRLHEHALLSIALEPDYELGGPYRLLGRLHAELPRVPLFSGWVDRTQAIPLIESALRAGPNFSGNRFLMALTLLQLAPDRRAEARDLLEQAAHSAPRAEWLIEDLAVRDAARRELEWDRAAGAPARGANQPSADLVLLSGSVYTVDAERSRAQAVAVSGRDIVYVGDDAGARRLIGPETAVAYLAGRMLLPGFHDSHMHAESASVLVYECNLYGLVGRQALLAKLRECAAADPASPWLRGAGWYPGLQELFREDLDEIAPDRPVYLVAMDGHHALVNSRALAAAGIGADTPNPTAGVIHRREDGEPSGLLIESAMWLPSEHLPPISREDRFAVLRAAMQEANRFGVTSVVEAWETPEWDPIWRELRRDGALTTRVMLALLVDENWDEDIEALVARRIAGDEWLRATQVKLLTDGVIENRTAAVKTPYAGSGGNRGFLYFTQEQLNRWIPLFEGRGFQIHAHTLGDRALAGVLDALERSRELRGKPNDRPAFVHCYLIDPADLPRLRAADATVNFTMLWRQMDALMTSLNRPVLDAERFARLMPMAEAAEFGLVVTGASDWYVSQIDPLASIAAGLTGKAVPYYRSSSYAPNSQPVMPGRRPSLETLIAAYTINGAYASRSEQFTGSIELGKRADLVILEKDLFEIPAEEIYGTDVAATLVDGRVVYGALP